MKASLSFANTEYLSLETRLKQKGKPIAMTTWMTDQHKEQKTCPK